MTHRFLASAVAALFLAGCNGGAAAPPSSSTGSTGGSQLTPLTIKLGGKVTSSAARSPRYIPSDTNTLGIKIGTDVLNAATNTYTNSFPSPEAFYDVSPAPSNANCKANGDGSRTCTVYIAVQPGTNIALQFDAFKEPYTAGFSANDPLATATLEDQTVTAGASAPISVALNGVPASMKWIVPVGSFGTSNGVVEIARFMQIFDASGERIAGAYASPVTVTLHEVNGSGHLQIAKMVGTTVVGTPGSTAVLTTDQDVVYFRYDGWRGDPNPDTSKAYYAYVTGLQVTADTPENEITPSFLTPSGYTQQAAPLDLAVGGGAQASMQFTPYEHGKTAADFTVDLSHCADGQLSAQGFTITALAPGPACVVLFRDDHLLANWAYVRSNGTPITITIH